VTRRRLVIVGGGEHAAVVVDAARTEPDAWELVGFSDPAPDPRAAQRLGLEHLGDDAGLADRLAVETSDRSWLVVGFGVSALARRAAVDRIGDVGRWATVVHRTAWVSPAAVIGEGSVILAGAIVNAGARIGRHVIINSRAVVEHDARIGDFVHLAPGALVGGGATIGEDTHVGLGSLVRDHVAIGAGATVGMGAVVTDDVSAGTTVIGSPARPRPTP
jgi:acetyltransferase EpsM